MEFISRISWISRIFTILYFIQISVDAQTLQLACDTGWTQISGKCYLIVPHNHTWINAKNYCSKYGAVLAEPKGYEVSQTLFDKAAVLGVNVYWIGYNRVNNEVDPSYTGYWSDGRSTGVDVGVWAPRQPAVTAGSCVYVSGPVSGDVHPRWYMDNCDHILPFVCERTPCPQDGFTCSNGRCVSFETRCNVNNDCGDYSDEQECDTLCNKYFTGTSGDISVTNTDNYVANMNCLYTIETDISRRVQIQFTAFDTEEKLDVLEIWDGGATISTSTLMTRLSGTDLGIYQSFMSSTNHLILRFLTDDSVQKSGFSITWSTDGPLGSLTGFIVPLSQKVAGQECILTSGGDRGDNNELPAFFAWVPVPVILRVTQYDRDRNPEFQCEINKVTNFRIMDGQTGYVKLLTARQGVQNCINECNNEVDCWGFTYDVDYLGDQSCYMVMVPPVIERDTCCEFYVKTCPGKEGVTSLTELPLAESSLEATLIAKYLYTPLYPFYYVGNIEVKYTITTAGNNLITLQIMKIDLCCSDSVYIHDGDGPSAARLATIDKSSSPGFVISTGQTMYIHMDLRTHWKCTGVIMTYVQGCTLEMTASAGEIRSPGYGATTYPGIMDCTWRIIPQSGNSIRLTFMDLQTEDSMDYLQIFREDDALTPLHQGDGYHGNMVPGVLTSAKNLRLTFKTSAIGNERGFWAVYSSGCPNFDGAGLMLTPAASSFHAPDKVSLSCGQGFTFGGSNVGVTSILLECGTDGQWNVTSTPFCEQSYCGLAPDLTNGDIVMASGVLGGDIIQYTCNEEFDMIGSEFVTCLSDGNWGEIPQCTSTQCPLLTDSFPDASLTVVTGNGTDHGSVVKVTCPEYEELIGPQNIICSKGDWRSSIPYCQPIPCPVPMIVNGYMNLSQTFNLNSNLFVECDLGFAIQTSPLIYSGYFHCGVDAPPTCTNIHECQMDLDACLGATCHDTDGSYTCTCLSGYRPVGTSSTLCEDIDECSSMTDFCEQACTNTPGSYECTCADGYEVYTSVNYNGFNLGTGEDGSKPWHQFHLNHSCVAKTCDSGIISSIPDGRAKTSKSIFFYGDQVEFVCDIGFLTPTTSLSRNTVTCGNDGTWSAVPLCEPAFCDDTFTNTDVEPQGRIGYEDKYTLRCTMRDGGIKVLERWCGFDKVSLTYKTYGPEFVCPATDCGPVPQPEGMRDFVTPCTTYNCTVPFECKDQYVRKGAGSVWAPFIVICTEDGTWDFGDLHCEGAQCPDPGYPPNGMTTLATWDNQGDSVPTVQNGSVATFSCNKDGYFPVPNPSITCRPFGSAMAWDGSVSGCEDGTSPVFENCPAHMKVRSFASIEFTIPTVIDNTAVKILDVYPDNFQPGNIASGSFTANYLAEDYNGNTAICSFRIIIEDVIAPMLTCNLPPVITAYPGNTVDTTQFASSDDPQSALASFPAVVSAGYDDIGSNPVVQHVGSDSSNNIGTCKNQVKIEGPKCNRDTLHVYNGVISCQTSAQGNSCEVTCVDNYVFYEDPAVDVLYVACSFGGEWSREMPICTAKDLAFYQVVSEFEYVFSTSTRVDASCGILYESQIREDNNLITITNALTEVCRAISNNQLDVSPATNFPVEAEINSEGTLVARLSVDITPEGLDDSIYRQCASEIYRAISEKTSAVSTIDTLQGGGSGFFACSEANLRSFSVDQTKSSFACSKAGTAAEETSTKHICLACPPGTFRSGFNCSPCPAGTYNDEYYKEVCTTCPNGTNSQSTGLLYSKSCYADCAMYLYSSDGKAPCTDCPKDTYWTNRTYCTPCPSNTHTKGRGAISSSECIAECNIGDFSSDGLQPCNPCPKNFFQGAANAEVCVECDTDKITTFVGATSSQDCIRGFDSVCLPNPCLNGGACSVVSHEFFCTCNDGYTGRQCETEVGTCDLDPCFNGGTCMQMSSSTHMCTCQDPFTGDSCEIDANDCTDVNCQNNGTCIDQRGTFVCACPSYSGYYGSFCQYTQNPCTLHPCENNGRCVEQANFYRVCDCMDGFTGVSCEVDLNECTSSPCMNGGTCQDSAGTFTCQCARGFRGRYCHLRDNTGLCGSDDCVNGDHCIDDYIAEEKFCVCQQGWYYDEPSGVCGVLVQYCDGLNCGTNGECFTYDGGYNVKCKCDMGYGGQTCVTNINDCMSYPCLNGGDCNDLVNDFSCDCTQTGTGGLMCADNVDGCENCVSASTQTCHDFINDYTCYCMDGYTGSKCETKIPSCTSLPCQHNGSCVDGVDMVSYTCTCVYPWTGVNCESEINVCASGTECENGGTCYSTSEGFSCMCAYGYIGERCEEEYDACNRLKPCVGSSTCMDIPPFPICECESGYTGFSCESLVWYCTDAICKNGGTCTIDENIGVVCACPEGYTSSDCGVDIDECASNACPSNSVCVDGIGTYTCVCQNGKIGENCRKDFSYDFDFVLHQFYSCYEDITYSPFSVTDTSAISIAFWVRFTDIVAPESIVTIYGSHSNIEVTSSSWASRITINSTDVKFDLRLSNEVLSGNVHVTNKNIVDGLWHHIAVTWSNVDGYLTLYIDGLYHNEIFFAENQILPIHGWILLGSELNSMEYFSGRITRFFIFNSKLVDAEVIRVHQGELSDLSIIDQESLMRLNTVDYGSQYAASICRSMDSCPDRPFAVDQLPYVSCPDDSMVLSERVSSPQWMSPTFTNTDSSSQRATHINGGTAMGWGVYAIGYAEYTADRRYAAVCSYRFYNRRTECSAVPVASGMTAVCDVTGTDDTRWCKVGCDASDYALTVESPVYHTCSKYGMWDQSERMTKYTYPACSFASTPSTQLTTNVDYTMVPDCASLSSILRTNITRSITFLDGKWNNGLCVFENRSSDSSCANVVVEVNCVGGAAKVTITMLYLSAEVRTGSTLTSPENAIKIGFADDSVFSFEPVATPVLSTLVVSPVHTCPEGVALVNDMCVRCGSGTYYNATLRECTQCSVGSYRTVTGSTALLTNCTPCPGSETTVSAGTQASSSCYLSCFYGSYFNTTTKSCGQCPVGFYNDVIGMQFCKSCGVDETTRSDGNAKQSACIAFSRLTTTTVPSGVPAVGASTEDGGLSAGLIAVIVICSLIFLLLLVLLLLCLTKKLPCFSDKVVPGETPWKHVNKYGETNLRHVNYRLSDIKEKKMKNGDKAPIYPEPSTPDDTLSMRTDISVHVPVFVEKLNGSVTRKHLFISNGRASDIGSDLDRTLGSEKGHSESGRLGTSVRSEKGYSESVRQGTSVHSESEYYGGAYTLPARPHKHHRRGRKGRPPADLKAKGGHHPRTLSPLAHTTHIPVVPQTSEYVHPLPTFSHQRQQVLTSQYEDFLEARLAKETSNITPPDSQSSERILLDSDDDDYR